MNIYNPVRSQTEEPSAQEWGKEADEAFSLVAHLLGDILAWLGSVLPLSPRAAAEQAVLAERGQALREDRRSPGEARRPVASLASMVVAGCQCLGTATLGRPRLATAYGV